MDFRDFSDIGNHVRSVVNDAIDSLNFDQLNNDIRKKADEVVSGWKPKENSANTKKGNSVNPNRHSANPVVRPMAPKNELVFPVARQLPGDISGTLMTVFGALGISIFGLGSFICAFLGFVIPGFQVIGGSIGLGLLPIAVGCGILFGYGRKRKHRIGRFKTYVKSLGNRTFCSIKDLARSIGRREAYVRKDVQKMLEFGYFPQGHLDDQQTCLMVTDHIYEQYLTAKEGMLKRESTKDDQATVREETKSQAVDQKMDALAQEGESYMQAIRRANDAIPDTEISNKLFRMELIVHKIFDYVRLHPEKMNKLQQFMDYYMPMTMKLVNAYKDFDQQQIQGHNIKKAKKDIEDTLDTINDAYEKLYDSMFQEAAMDISSDISVLQTLLAQEGLTKKDF